jgi:hypothetical protein
MPNLSLNKTSFLLSVIRWIPVLLRISIVLALLWGVIVLGQWLWQSWFAKPSVLHSQSIHGQRLNFTTTLGEDEQALLLLRSSAFLTLLQQQSYGQLYDTWASEALKQTPHSRSVFLKMAYCSERFLGKMIGYNKSAVVVLKVLKPSVAYHVIIQADREHANTREKLVLLPYGLDYRWVGYFILTPNVDFHTCLESIAHPRNPFKNPV